MSLFSHVFMCLIPALMLTGCRSYQAAQLDWAQERSDWADTSAANVPMTLAEARQCALILNPEINALRLRLLASRRFARAAGWWDDPALDIDALRILRGGPHPWLGGAGLTFTLPLTGVPGLERQVAQAYSRADALSVIVAERELLAEVERLWNACLTDRRCAAAQNDYKARLLDREPQVSALIAAGELPASEGDRLAQELIKLDLACACCGAETVTRQQALRRLLGLHPSTPIDLAADPVRDDTAMPTETDAQNSASGMLPESELELVRHPRVQEKLARLAAGEAELLAEIRKQYPDISLGPKFGHEEGGGRLGVSLGLSLPLWNRNRKGIATAEGGRDAARLAALNEWRSLVAEWHDARRLLQIAEAKERGIREQQLPAALAAAERTELLFRQGEADVTAALAADEQVYMAQEALIEARRVSGEARVSLYKTLVPPLDPERHTKEY
ncbi:MAG: TolC family protein [Kiritimatiellae bacterium]|nr:TolC family protein [Kiritimatiellia bacterium]